MHHDSRRPPPSQKHCPFFVPTGLGAQFIANAGDGGGARTAGEAALQAAEGMADTEHAVHARFQHPCIVRLVGFSRGETPTGERGRRCLVYELLHGGSVDAVLRDAARAAHFTWKLRVRAAYV